MLLGRQPSSPVPFEVIFWEGVCLELPQPKVVDALERSLPARVPSVARGTRSRAANQNQWVVYSGQQCQVRPSGVL